jgi:hypothetical protein
MATPADSAQELAVENEHLGGQAQFGLSFLAVPVVVLGLAQSLDPAGDDAGEEVELADAESGARLACASRKPMLRPSCAVAQGTSYKCPRGGRM